MSSRVWEQIRDSLDPKDTIIAFYRYLTKGFQQRIAQADADVQCRITHHRLVDCEGDYETLSYVWGDTKEPVPLTIGDHFLPISQSLYQALVDLRHEDKPRRIWVDAVCIDQGNLQERSEQVSVMGQIYRGAKRVVIYLGAAYPERTKKAYDLIETCATEAFRINANLSRAMTLSSLSQGSQIKHGIDSQQVLNMDIVSLRHLGGASWWARSWTAQEVLLARDALVVTGTHSMEWKRFCTGVDFGLYGDIIDVVVAGIMIDSIIQPYLSMHTLRMELEEKPAEASAAQGDSTGSAAQRLLALLIHCRFRKATDRRDKVYAFLGLKDLGHSGPPTSLGIVPDYTADDAEVYRNAAQQVILHSGGLEILGACLPDAPEEGKSSMGIPSWVPDWSNAGPAPRPLMYDTFGGRRSSHATLAHTPAPGFADNGKTLVLSGHRVTSIAALSPMFRRPQIRIDEEGFTTAIFGQSFPVRLFTVLFYVPITAIQLWLFYREMRDTIVGHLGYLADMEAFAREVVPTNPVTVPTTATETTKQSSAAEEGQESQVGEEETNVGEEDRLIEDEEEYVDETAMYIYRRTLCAGAEAAGGPAETNKLFRDWRAKLAPLFAMHARGVDRWFSGRILYKYMRTTWKGFSTFTRYLEMAYERRLARGENGYLLLVPGHAEVGDQVVLVKEGRVPLVLRPEEGGAGAYKVVGEAYGEGIMDGEAFREQDCAEIRIH
ncbi:hypothetical protein PG989_014738 [Apiospora arundinis]